ncbi:hypothetical protein HY485_01880 [Candidatus Woesearchaeota archaeon]|nr:hypothetical protein [Candidatus Woesearchaeota archaeon]
MDHRDDIDVIDSHCRREFIQDEILERFPSEEHVSVYDRCEHIAGELFRYYDMRALNVLANAAQQGCFDEFAARLEDDYERFFSSDSLNVKKRTPTDVEGKKCEYLLYCLGELTARKKDEDDIS